MRHWVMIIILFCFIYPAVADVIIDGNEEVTIKVQGIKGDKGDKGEKGDPGSPGTGTGALDWINVKDLSAKGDGTTDDTAVFKSAIEKAGKGGTIYIPRGHYIITDTLLVTERINIIGDGIDCQIFQQENKHLFHFHKVREIHVEGLTLGSQAVSSEKIQKAGGGKAVVRLENVHYSTFERVFCYGADYGFQMMGCLGLTFNYCGQKTYPLFWKPLHYSWAIWYGHGYRNFSVNHISIYDPFIQCGIYGIRMENTLVQGGITIQGGVIEGMQAASIYLSGLTNNWSIEGLHCESLQSGIVIDSCRSGSIRNCMVASEQGIVFRGGSGNELHGGHIKNLTVEPSETRLIINGVQYGNRLDIRGSIITVKNARWDGGTDYGSYGNYTWDGGQQSILKNGGLEDWINGKPVGFIIHGKVEQETEIVLSGTYSAKITILASNTSQAALRIPIYSKKYATGRHAVTISAWVYVPKENGAIPRLAIYWGGYGGSYICPQMELVRDKWTPITFTVYTDEKNPYLSQMSAVWGVWYNRQEVDSVFYIDDLEVVEGMR